MRTYDLPVPGMALQRPAFWDDVHKKPDWLVDDMLIIWYDIVFKVQQDQVHVSEFPRKMIEPATSGIAHYWYTINKSSKKKGERRIRKARGLSSLRRSSVR